MTQTNKSLSDNPGLLINGGLQNYTISKNQPNKQWIESCNPLAIGEHHRVAYVNSVKSVMVINSIFNTDVITTLKYKDYDDG